MSTFKVSDISCGHCEKVIKTELTKGNPDIKVNVNIQEKTVDVENLPDDRVIFILNEIGYNAEKIKH